MEHQELTGHICRLITLAETESPVVSYFVNLEMGQPGYRPTLTARARVLRKALLGDEGRDFEQSGCQTPRAGQ